MLIVPQDRSQPIPGHPDWLASSDGHIYQTDGTLVREYRKEAGENRLRVSCKAHSRYHDVARLIYEAWREPVLQGWSVIHRNGDTADNRPVNLRIVKEAGSNSYCAGRRRLTRGERQEIHRQLDLAVPKTRIGAAMGISPRCVRYHSTSCHCGFTPSVVNPTVTE